MFLDLNDKWYQADGKLYNNIKHNAIVQNAKTLCQIRCIILGLVEKRPNIIRYRKCTNFSIDW